MSIGLIGKKVGMTRVFNKETGAMIPVTVIDVADNTFAQVKTEEKEGYNAVQVAFGSRKESRLSRPVAGHYKKLGIEPAEKLMEFRVTAEELPQEGATHPGCELFAEGAWVDVIGTSKGKGFQGVMRRHNFHGSPMTHGSMMHRRTGGVVQNLRVVQVRKDDHVILVSGPVPGARGSYVVIRPAKKKLAK